MIKGVIFLFGTGSKGLDPVRFTREKEYPHA